MGAVEEYLSAFQTGLSQPGDVLNVPVTLLDDAWVASHRICAPADATLVGTVVGMSPPGAVSWVHVDVECYFEVLDMPSGDPCLRRFVRPPALLTAASKPLWPDVREAQTQESMQGARTARSLNHAQSVRFEHVTARRECVPRRCRPNHAAQLCVAILSRLKRLQRVAQRPYRRS